MNTVKRGEKYSKAMSTMALNILDFNLFRDCGDFNTNFTFYDPDHDIALSDKVRIGYVELPKILEHTPEQLKSDERVAWAAFFNAKREEEFDMLTQTTANPDVKKAVTVIRELSEDERLIEQARRREEAIFEEWFALNGERSGAIEETQSAFVDALSCLGVDEDVIQEALLRVQDTMNSSTRTKELANWKLNR